MKKVMKNAVRLIETAFSRLFHFILGPLYVYICVTVQFTRILGEAKFPQHGVTRCHELLTGSSTETSQWKWPCLVGLPSPLLKDKNRRFKRDVRFVRIGHTWIRLFPTALYLFCGFQHDCSTSGTKFLPELCQLQINPGTDGCHQNQVSSQEARTFGRSYRFTVRTLCIGRSYKHPTSRTNPSNKYVTRKDPTLGFQSRKCPKIGSTGNPAEVWVNDHGTTDHASNMIYHDELTIEAQRKLQPAHVYFVFRRRNRIRLPVTWSGGEILLTRQIWTGLHGTSCPRSACQRAPRKEEQFHPDIGQADKTKLPDDLEHRSESSRFLGQRCRRLIYNFRLVLRSEKKK
ncbi:unnamed protein product [Xylocopa violacea]|uniref:Uncharacterized protein n=1 Tax=Xylocopa violacea TaxID=135666 RepID=A0ABP1NDV7_XYLVO